MSRRVRPVARRRAAPACVLAIALALEPARPGPAREIHPQDAYVGATTTLGLLGGGALGAALGGLSRAEGGGRVAPFLRWGGVGAGIGGLLGYEVGRATVARNGEMHVDSPTEPSREMTACVGTLLGELAGLGIGALISRPFIRENRDIWAGITVGALVGAAGGFLIPPLRAFAPPRPVSRAQRERGIERARIEPLLPTEPMVHGRRMTEEPIERALTARQTRALTTALLDAENEQRAAVAPPVMHERPALLLPHLPPPPELATIARSLTALSLLEGAALGAAVGGGLSADAAGAGTRLGLGAGLGALAGWSVASAMSRPWLAGSDGGWGTDEGMEDARRLGGVCAGGLLGALAGGAAGLAARSVEPGTGRDTIALASLAGNAAGLLAGWLITGR